MKTSLDCICEKGSPLLISCSILFIGPSTQARLNDAASFDSGETLFFQHKENMYVAKVILQNSAGLALFTVMVKYGYTTELIFIILASD